MFCTQCGASVPEGMRFCANCGYPVDQAASSAKEGRAADGLEEDERLAQLQRDQAEALQAERERVLESYEAARNVETTPVARVLDDGRVAYETLPVVSAEEPPKDAKAELKEAKAAYKEARKGAGKSAAPKVIAIVVAIVVIFGAGAGAMWWLLGQQSGPMPTLDSSSSSVSDSAASTGSSSAGVSSDTAPLSSVSASAGVASSSASAPVTASSSTGSQGGIESYVGTWKGNLVEPTKYAFVACCYGAEGHALILDVKEASSTGRITADVSVLFHEHEALRDSDAATSEGDTYLKLHDLVGTLSDEGTLSFHDDLAERGEGEGITIAVKTVDSPDGKRTLEATVDSQVIGGHATDFYVLEKQ